MTEQTQTPPSPVDTTRSPDVSDAANRSLMFGCVGVLIAISVFLIGAAVGFGLGRWNSGGVTAQNVVAGALNPNAAGGPAAAELEPKFGVFWEAMNLLYRDFYGELPSDDDATYGAIRGVLGELDDPNTSFMEPEEAEFFRTSIEGAFEGIGARVQWNDDFDTVQVVEPFENQPAWNAGIRRGDLILAVDGETVVGTNVTDAVMRIRGPKGSTVLLNIAREGEAEPFDVEVMRDRIELPTIGTDTLGEAGDIAYVKLNTFNENAGQLVREAVEQAMQNDPAGIIFDLRGNTGGLLREAVKVASVFMDDQDVLIERFSDGREETYATSGKAAAADVPLVVLVNGGSASASEIVAGALQDAGRAQLIGTTTFGKGSVQLPHSLSDGGIMRVTIARWYTPLDRSIDGSGLEPDEVVELTEEDRDAERDPQLDVALAALEKQKN